jgi:hypothetical protein
MWPSDCEPVLNELGEVHNIENYRLVSEAFARLDPISIESAYRAVIDLRNSGQLIRKVATNVYVPQRPSEPEDPFKGDPMPHPNDQLLKDVTTFERAVKLSKKFVELGGEPMQRFNDRFAWIQRHRELLQETAQTAVPEHSPKETETGEYAIARQVIDKMSHKDFHNSARPFVKCQRLQESLYGFLDSAKSRNVKGDAALKFVRERIREATSDSIA